MISSKVFWTLLALSLVLVATFYAGMRKNIRFARRMAEILESVFNPIDKTYTWLGGVIGFAADYKVKGFKKIYANFRLFPRHSLLWFPFAFLSGKKDTLQLLYYLKCNVGQEFHVIKQGMLKPKIYNKEKLKRIRDKSFDIYYEFSTDMKEEILSIAEKILPFFSHIAVTPQKNIFYIELKGSLVSKEFEKALRDVTAMIRKFQEKRS